MVLLGLGSLVLGSGCGTPRCAHSNCPTGCCDSNGACQSGTATAACGIAGNACTACQFTQQCIQGSCFGATGGGGGVGGGTGGGTGGGGGGGLTGGGGATGGGGGGGGLIVYPMQATVPFNSELVLSALLVGNPSDPRVNFTLESGVGGLIPNGESSAIYYSTSSAATVRIRASANFMSSVAQLIDLTIDGRARELAVLPQGFSQLPYTLAPNTPQTFAAVRAVSSNAVTGVNGADFILFPSLASSTTGTLTIAADQTRLYARENASNVFASTDLLVASTTEPSIAITPAVATTSPNSVVQLTAMVSSGDPVLWEVVSGPGTGSVSTGGTYTAPASPGLYVVRATALNGSGLRYALATIIVQ